MSNLLSPSHHHRILVSQSRALPDVSKYPMPTLAIFPDKDLGGGLCASCGKASQFG